MAKNRSIISRIFRFILFVFITVLVLFGGFLGYMTLRDYKPQPVEDVAVEGNGLNQVPADTFTLVTWNVGYFGLGADQDFFFDGGKNVRPTHEQYNSYSSGAIETIKGFTGTDFIFLQEVDRGSKRSYFNDQVPQIASVMPGYYHGFATNYKSLFVPQPVSEPYGKCYGGLLTLSKYKPHSARRYKLAQDASWPTGLFMLKRCYMSFRYSLPNGKSLVLINQHMSAYDDGTVKQRQMDTLKSKLIHEYEQGNYVVVGGDWNQFPPDYKPQLSGTDGVVGMNVEKDFPQAGWSWIYDPNTTTNRKLVAPYKKGTTEEVIIDYFLISPNVTPLEVKGIVTDFKNSDHQPVWIKLALKK